MISPISQDKNGQHYNVNADVAAAAVAGALEATLCFVSDIPGIYVQSDTGPKVLNRATPSQIESLIAQGEFTGGMIS